MSSRLFVSLGFLFLVIGIIGIAVPLLPTTPFLILAAYFFGKGSPKFHSWLLNHPKLGPPVLDWQQRRAIQTKYKILATLMMLGSSYFVFSKDAIPDIGKISFGVFLVLLLSYIWTRNK